MSDVTAEMVAWLTKILAEDEAIAVAAPGRQWRAFRQADVAGASVYDEQWVLLYPQRYDHDKPMSAEPGATGPAYIERARDALCAHIARHDPAAALARIAAERQILALHTPQWNDSPHIDNDYFGCLICMDDEGCPTLRLLGAAHAGRPGYRQEWSPR